MARQYPASVDAGRPRTGGWVGAITWLAPAVPFFSLGFGTAPIFLASAARLRSWSLAGAAAGYGLATVGVIVLPANALSGACVVATWIGGTFHGFFVRQRLAQSRRPETPIEMLARIAAEERNASGDDPVLRAIVRRREQRQLAREIAAKDPRLAAELGIGRPSGDARFDDGGLIDVNSVDPAVLATLPGFDVAMADRVVQARQRLDGLRSTADLVLHADVPPEVVDQIADRLLFGVVGP